MLPEGDELPPEEELPPDGGRTLGGVATGLLTVIVTALDTPAA
jgi:hypothetical protein